MRTTARRCAVCAGPLLLLLLAAPPSAAALTLGPTNFGTPFGTTTGADLTFLNTAAAPTLAESPFDGVVTRWRVRGSGHMAVRVLRPGGGPTTYSGRARGPTVTPATAGTNTFPVRIPIDAGDYVGIDLDEPDGVMMATNSPPGWGSLVWGPRLGAAAAPANLISGDLFNYNADVEPDTDGDGFGDESQDRCLGATGADRGCAPGILDPQPAQVVQTVTPGGSAEIDMAGVRFTKGRAKLAVPVRCPAGRPVRCIGRLSVRSASKLRVPGRRGRRTVRLGSARVNLAPGTRRTFSVRVPRGARRAIRRLKRIRLTVTISAAGTKRL